MFNIAKKIVEVYDWALKPPTAQSVRAARSLAEFNKDRMIEPLDF
jgi:hypothetical protein